MKKSMCKKVLSATLCMIMIVCLISTSVFAANAATLDGTPTPLADGTGYELKLSDGDSIRFYNILDAEESIAAMDKSKYIRRCLESVIPQYSDDTAISLSAGASPANLWLYLGIEAQDQLGKTTGTAKFKTQFDNVLNTYINNYGLGITKSISDGDNTYNVSTSGLQHTASMQKAGTAIENTLFTYYQNAKGTRAKEDAVTSNACFNDTTTQDVYWTLISANKTSGTYKKGHYQAVAVIFSDFTLSPLFAADSGNTYTIQYLDESGNEVAEEEGKSTKYLTSVAVSNASSQTATLSKTVSYTSTISTTSEVNGTQEYSFGQSIGAGVNLGQIANIELSLDFGQAISDGWSKTDSTESSITEEVSISTTVPAYTVAMINSKEESWTTRISYDCPLALGYKVTIVEYTLDPSSNSAAAYSRVLATYGTDSRTTLYQSVVQGKGTDQIDWSADANAKAIARKLATTMPYSVSGASVTSTNTVTTFDILDFSPYYSLSSVKTQNTYSVGTDGKLPLGIDGQFCVDSIVLEGYNAQGGVYYGFRQSAGEWVLMDSSGAEIGQGSVSAPARLFTGADGKVYLLGQYPGEVYLKYKIKENVYSSSSEPNTFATNDTITTAIIPVKIVDSVSMGTPTYMEQTGSYLIESTTEDLMKDMHNNDVLKTFDDDGSDSYGVVDYIAYMSEDEARDHIDGQLLTQELIDGEAFGKTFYVRAVVNNHFSEYVKIVLKQKSDTAITYGDTQYDSESRSDNHIVVEDSMLEPASPVEAVDCGGLHTGGTATCTAKAVCADCGESYGELDSHRDENGDYKCDVCGKAIGTPSDNPQTGDNSNLTLWFALLIISSVGVFGLTVYERKRNATSKR